VINIFFLTSFIVLGFLYLKSSRAKASTKRIASAKREEARGLIREIDRAIRMLKDKDFD